MSSEGVRDFLVPDLGEGLEDATVTGWSVEVGDDVELNQTLCTVETNKAEVEIPSPYAGKVVELGGAEGDTLAVGAVLVRIATDAPAPASQNGGGPKRKPVLVGYGADDEMDTSRRAPVEGGTRPRAKPPVRKLAAELQVDLAALAPARARTESSPARMCSPPRGSRARARTRLGCTVCRPRWRSEWRCRVARFPMRTPVFRSTARLFCGCVTGCARRWETTGRRSPRSC